MGPGTRGGEVGLGRHGPAAGWLAIWSLAPLAVPGTGDRAAYAFAAVLTPLSLLGLWLCRPR